MDLISLDLPCQPRQEILDLPEAQLIYAVIQSAWDDAHKRIDCHARLQAREWFFSTVFEEYCDLLCLSTSVIQSYALQSWSN
ncbi:MAG: hypothetical protein U1E78_11780 [Gammaproteobacteria bacterium]